MAKQETPEIFGRKRTNVGKIYELLKAAEDLLPRTRIWQAARSSVPTDIPLFLWLWEQGFIAVTHESKEYMAYYRNTHKHIKGLFHITAKGAAVVQAYERLFDMLGLSEQALMRFPGDETVVKTKRFSGQKVRV